MSDKRKHIRLQEKLFAEFVVEKNRYCGTILNIGTGSAYIQTQGPFSIGDTVKIICQSGVPSSGAVNRSGTIKRVTDAGIGVEFETLG